MLLFPHDSIRKTQDKLISDIQASIKRKQHILIHAPTGIGKTAAILSAVLTETLDKNITIFFLTPKHTQHRIVIDTIRSINQKHNSNVQCIDLIGKRWMCAQPGVTDMNPSDFSEYCKNMIENGRCEYYTNLKFKGKPSPETEITLKEL